MKWVGNKELQRSRESYDAAVAPPGGRLINCSVISSERAEERLPFRLRHNSRTSWQLCARVPLLFQFSYHSFAFLGKRTLEGFVFCKLKSGVTGPLTLEAK